ncbi:MAG: D-cysteine desulfhydrase family protein [Candidatus Electryoneaceae bacterium]|nr:D-cysteine desulfhydrase family protein [Candidatus Electryoneaceae bacterium]
MNKNTIIEKTVRLAHIPTPLHRLDRLSDGWGGDIWIKRDDLTGSGLSGNKVRKLEFLLSDAIRNSSDTIITCGGTQSNHCRATALASARLGFRCLLLLNQYSNETSFDHNPSLDQNNSLSRSNENLNPSLDGNLLLDRLAGAELHYVADAEFHRNLPERLSKLAEKVVSQGGNPYIVTEGGSDPVGAWGYVEAAKEAMNQCRLECIKPKRIICATGSGGTHAGLLVGARLYGWDVDIISVSVCHSAPETAVRIGEIVDRMIDRYGLNIRIPFDDVKVWDGYRGLGYAKAGRDELEVIAEMARTEGILIDPVYTGKAARGLKTELVKGNIDGTTLFWHTGGMFGLFPFRREFEEILN